MIQDTTRRRQSTSSLESHSSSRDSPGTPTPNPRQSKDNSRLASSNVKTQEHGAFEFTTNIPKVPQSLPSTLSSDGADDSDGECSMTSSDPEDPASSNCSEHLVAKVYDQYDLNGFTPQDFDLLLTLAPADQLPDLTTSEVKADGASSLRDGRSATHTAIKRYVIFHKFNQEPYASHTISQRRAFERNVYDYARANGLGKQEALREVYKARVIGGAPEDDSDDSSFGPEVDDTSEILAHLAKTTFSYRDIQMERITATKEYEPQEPKQVNKDRKKTRRGRKTGGDKHNVADTQKPITGNANVEQANSNGTEVPSITGSVPVDKTRSSRRKRKRMDVEAAGDTTPPREAKKSRHFQRCDNEQSTTQQSRHSIDRNGGTMEVDAPLEKYTNMQHTTPTLPKETKKATRRQEKINRRREKRAAKSKEQLHSKIKEPREEQNSGADVAQVPSVKVVDAKPANSELLAPAEKKKRIRRKGKSRESESKAGASSSRPEGQAGSKKLGPNDPKSEREAHQNFLNANMHDPQESTLPADKTPRTRKLAEAERKQSSFIEKLDALKRFSNEKQLQLYEDGKYSNADKQTKDDLKDLKEEKTKIEEIDIETRNVAKSPENKEKKKSTGSAVKRDKAAKVEVDGVEKSGDIESTNVSRDKNRKRRAETQENVPPNGQADFQ